MISGALRGIVRALVTGAALIIGLLFAARGYGVVSAIIRGVGVESKETANAVGFLFIVLAVFATGFFAGRLISKGLRRLHLEWLDRLLGGAFGLLRGWAVCSVLYLALTAFPVHLSSVTGAQTAPLLAAGAKMLGVFTSQDVRTRFYKSYTDLFNSK
jgi:membrane protein required for colicin V production